MRQRAFIGIVVLLFALSIGMAAAQGGGGRGFGRGGFGRGGGGLSLLRMTEVQQELKMTPDQVSKLDDAQQSVRDQMQDAMQSSGGSFQDMTPQQRQDLSEKMQAINEKAVAGILNPDQMKRYHELELQRQGAQALTQKPVQDQLGLSPAQRAHITEIRDKAMADMRASMQGQDFQSMSQEDRQKLFQKMRATQEAVNTKIVSVLTPAQRDQWTKMQGAPFKFPARAGGFGGRRRGGQGGGEARTQ